ncbi:MAG: amidohydrolase family protein [Saprospiraceae bacterium]|nr:amidohydrolase family protein [Saprospiraceae bacterium]
MRIDSHQHFWQYSPSSHSWINDEMQVLKRDFLPSDLEPLLTSRGMDGCVAVQAAQHERETDFLIHLADQHSFIKGVVGWVDLRAKNVEARLSHYAQFPVLKGFRHIVQDEPDPHFLLQPDFCRGIEALQKFGFTYDILVYPIHLEVAYLFASRFPEQPFVVDHLAKPYIKQQEIEPWASQMRKLASLPHVYCKLSGMVTEADWKHWHSRDFKPYTEVILEAFGAERVMIGSDWPVCLLAGNYGRVIHLGEELISALNPTDRTKIMGGNAARFYNLLP